MRNLLIFTLLFISLVAYGQQEEEWLQMLNNPKYDTYRLQQENIKAKFYTYDFSSLMVPRPKFQGFLGNYFRMGMQFTAISKSLDSVDIYNIKGVSHFGNVNYEFAGTIRMDQVRAFVSMHFGADQVYQNKGMLQQGIFIGSYEFKENPKVPFSGILKGMMTLYWYLDKAGKLCYDDIELFSSDLYRNNQYAGNWTIYGGDRDYVCNWGESRIPFSGDLDIGTSEFAPNPKYYDRGWGNMDADLPVVRGSNLK
jgi:hypothetical protein